MAQTRAPAEAARFPDDEVAAPATPHDHGLDEADRPGPVRRAWRRRSPFASGAIQMRGSAPRRTPAAGRPRPSERRAGASRRPAQERAKRSGRRPSGVAWVAAVATAIGAMTSRNGQSSTPRNIPRINVPAAAAVAARSPAVLSPMVRPPAPAATAAAAGTKREPEPTARIATTVPSIQPSQRSGTPPGTGTGRPSTWWMRRSGEKIRW